MSIRQNLSKFINAIRNTYIWLEKRAAKYNKYFEAFDIYGEAYTEPDEIRAVPRLWRELGLGLMKRFHFFTKKKAIDKHKSNNYK